MMDTLYDMRTMKKLFRYYTRSHVRINQPANNDYLYCNSYVLMRTVSGTHDGCLLSVIVTCYVVANNFRGFRISFDIIAKQRHDSLFLVARCMTIHCNIFINAIDNITDRMISTV